MESGRQRYLSYLLRLWKVGDGAEVAWRASLQNPQTGERRGFPDPESLFRFLRRQISAAPPHDDLEDSTEG